MISLIGFIGLISSFICNVIVIVSYYFRNNLRFNQIFYIALYCSLFFICLSFFALMFAEAFAYSLVLGVVLQSILRVGGLSSVGPGNGTMQNFALSLGAGLFEEIIFRVLLLNLLFLLLKPLLRNKVTTAVVSVLAASFLFSMSHYIGSMADSWQLYSFMFRWAAGLLFTVLYFMRGFAITAYTHALYDIWVLV